MPPTSHVAVLKCMEGRFSDAHVIRNAGGVVTDDASARSPSPNACSGPGRSSSSTIRSFVYDIETGILREIV